MPDSAASDPPFYDIRPNCDNSSYDWHYRPVYIFASKSQTAQLSKQLELFMKHRAAMTDRNMALIAVTDKTVIHHGPEFPLCGDQLHKDFGVPKDSFTVLLVGKDTGVKRRHDGLIDPAVIFAQIDGMPMRRREMRQRP